MKTKRQKLNLPRVPVPPARRVHKVVGKVLARKMKHKVDWRRRDET